MWERLDEVALLFFFGPHTTHVLISIVHLTLGKNSCDMFEFSLTWSGNQGKIETPPNQPNRMAEFNFNSNISKERTKNQLPYGPCYSLDDLCVEDNVFKMWTTRPTCHQVWLQTHRGDADLFNIWVDPCVC